MIKALEDTTETLANKQLQDMWNNAIIDPEKFHDLGLKTKSINVGTSRLK